MALDINPLTWNVPIVDARGRPSKEFQIKWQQLNKAARSIPNLDTPEAVSAVLDILTAGGVNGSLLVRSGGAWQGYPSPSDATKFLAGSNPPTWQSVDDADLNLADVLTNNVSTSKHGFAPKLPNDATKFLNGTGAWSAPATGGGGIDPFLITPPFDPAQSAPASGGGILIMNPFTASQNFTLTGIKIRLQSYGGAHIVAGIYAAASGGVFNGATLLAQSAALTPVTGAIMSLPLSAPVNLTAGTPYWAGIYYPTGTLQPSMGPALPWRYIAHGSSTLPNPISGAGTGSGSTPSGQFWCWGY